MNRDITLVHCMRDHVKEGRNIRRNDYIRYHPRTELPSLSDEPLKASISKRRKGTFKPFLFTVGCPLRDVVFVEVVVIVMAVAVVDVVSLNSDGSPNPSSVLKRLLT